MIQNLVFGIPFWKILFQASTLVPMFQWILLEPFLIPDFEAKNLEANKN